ncbi:ATP-binding protein [Dactylosporangium sp. NPDC005555]|uniref:sensor histidine kinase n=1 Tax=Dactylosporangium sp. NPDC005555 TaxID=3154889 RepID=UPI0033AFBEB0
MVDARGPVDATAVFGGLAEIAEQLATGAGGLPALQRTVDVTVEATAAAGAAFIEYGQDSGRVVAAAAALDWSLGRPVDLIHPTLRGLLQYGTRVREFPVGLLGTVGGEHLRGRGLTRFVAAEVNAGKTAVGVLVGGYHDADGTAGADERAALGFLAGLIGLQYTLGRGLPIHAGGPVFDPVAVPFAVLDADHVVRTWNPAAALLTARSPESAIGAPWPFPLPAGAETVEHQMACGTWIQIRAAAMPATTDVGVSFRARGDQSADGRDLFIALTGHELRTPITVIRGYADTLVEHWESLDEGSRREAIYVVGQRARELSRLVDRLLNAVGDEAAPGDASALLPFDLVDTLTAAVVDLSPEQRRTLSVSLPQTLPKALGERATLATILAEFVTNAGKYSLNWVEADLTAGADAQTVWFKVADRGIGIRPEHVERAFERFWQLETGDQRTRGGVGLGLYLVRRIVERQHGWVSLRPRQGGGTVAEVRLPRADADAHGEA